MTNNILFNVCFKKRLETQQKRPEKLQRQAIQERERMLGKDRNRSYSWGGGGKDRNREK
jgi:hypothetical protein